MNLYIYIKIINLCFDFSVVECSIHKVEREPSKYNDLLEQNITKSYKKATPNTVRDIHKENKKIATKLGIDDRVDTTAYKDAFITLKDHKPNFDNKATEL